MKRGQPIQQMVLVQLALSMQKNENRPFLISLYKAQVLVDQNLHIKPDKLKLLDEKIRKTLEHIDTGENILNKTPLAQSLRLKINKWDLMRLQSFCKAKDIVKKQNGSQQNGKRSSPTPHQIEA